MTGPLELKKIATTSFSNLWFSWQYMGVFDLFVSIAYYQPFFVAETCTQVSSPVSKLEITRLLRPLYVFKSSRAHFRRCVFCSSMSK